MTGGHRRTQLPSADYSGPLARSTLTSMTATSDPTVEDRTLLRAWLGPPRFEPLRGDRIEQVTAFVAPWVYRRFGEVEGSMTPDAFRRFGLPDELP